MSPATCTDDAALGLLVCVRRDGELRITTERHIECFARERILNIVRTKAGVEIRTPDRWHSFRLSPELAAEAMRAKDAPAPTPETAPEPKPKTTRAPTRHVSPRAYNAARAALMLWGDDGAVSLKAACERNGVSVSTVATLTRKGAALRNRYELAVQSRQALKDIRSIVGRGER